MSFVTRFRSLAIVTLISLAPQFVFAMGFEGFGNKNLDDEKENYRAWPGVMQVINNDARVYRNWVNGHEQFCFKGTTDKLNQTLKDFAQIELVDTREVVLSVGPGKWYAFNKAKIAIDWSLEIMGGLAGATIVKGDQGDKIWSPTPVLTVYVSNEFNVHEIVIPAGVTVIGPRQLSRRIGQAILDSKDITTRGWGCGRLANISPYDIENLEVVGKCLRDPDNWVQVNAVSSITCFGKKAEKYLPRLQELANSEGADLSRASTAAIKKITTAADTSAAEVEFGVILTQIEDFVARQNKKIDSK